MDKIKPLLARIAAAERTPRMAQQMFAHCRRELAAQRGQMRALDKRLMAWHTSNELSRRLVNVPTIRAGRSLPVCDQGNRSKGFRIEPHVCGLAGSDTQGSLHG